MLALIAGTVSYLYMHRACESGGNVSESPRIRASSQLNRANFRHRGDSTASAAACGPDPHADVEGDRTLNS